MGASLFSTLNNVENTDRQETVCFKVNFLFLPPHSKESEEEISNCQDIFNSLSHSGGSWDVWLGVLDAPQVFSSLEDEHVAFVKLICWYIYFVLFCEHVENRDSKNETTKLINLKINKHFVLSLYCFPCKVKNANSKPQMETFDI